MLHPQTSGKPVTYELLYVASSCHTLSEILNTRIGLTVVSWTDLSAQVLYRLLLLCNLDCKLLIYVNHSLLIVNGGPTGTRTLLLGL